MLIVIRKGSPHVKKKMFSFGHCPNYLPPIRATCTTFFGCQKNDVLTRITEPYNSDGSDIVIIIVTFIDLR